jgi:hypothetical protein
VLRTQAGASSLATGFGKNRQAQICKGRRE